MRILVWHVHGSWATSFVQGGHDYLIPLAPDRGADGGGRPHTWDWPSGAREVPLERLRDEPVDVVVLQRERDLELCRTWLGREPGRGVPAVFVEHNTPKGDVPLTRHLLADQGAIPIAHVTYFNELFWDNGRARSVVIEHGVVDPGHLYTGELERAGIAINEPVRRGRVTGSDLLARFAEAAPLDVFGMRLSGLHESFGLDPSRVTLHEDPPQHVMHAELARRRVYVHPLRWTSLGLSLIEAMHLGMPVVVLASTEAIEAVPQEAGYLSTRVDALMGAVRRYLSDPDAARAAGDAARAHALERYGLGRFLADWDALLKEVVG